MTVSFQRARTPQQRQERRSAILDTTRELLREGRVVALSLNEIARRVGLAKSNVLRYFGSREAILLVVTEQEYGSWVDAVGASADIHRVGDLAAVLAREALARPLLCDLLSQLATVLEHNVTAAEIAEFKLAIYAHIERLQGILERVLGPLPENTRATLVIGIHGLVTQFWALGNPAPALVAAAAADPRVIASPTDLEFDLSRAIELLLAGAKAEGLAVSGAKPAPLPTTT